MRAVRAMFKYVSSHPVLWAIGLIVPALAALTANLVFAYGMQAYAAELIGPGATLGDVVRIMLAALAGLVVFTLVEDAARYAFVAFVAQTENNVKQDLFSALINARYAAVSGLNKGELITRYNEDTVTAANLIAGDLFGVLYPIVVGTGYLVCIFLESALIAGIMLLLVVSVMLLNLFFVRRFAALEKECLLAREGFARMCESAVRGRLYIRQLSAGGIMAERIAARAQDIFDREDARVRLSAGRALSLELLETICTALMTPLACVLAALGLMPLPAVVLIAQLCRHLIGYTRYFGVALTLFRTHSVSHERLREILRMPGEATGEGERVQSRAQADALAFRGVGVSYDGNRILEGVDLTVKAGQIVALIGPSGSGKSSLIKALLRLIDYSGAISVHGTDIGALSLDALRRRIAYVPEHSELFDATVRENVAYADMDADDERIDRALCDAAFGDPARISQRQAGRGGERLSGGQRQRVAIARALLKAAPIIVLDEPTASLDASSEAKVLETLEGLKKQGKSILIITHRESTMKIADRFALLKGGTVMDGLTYRQAMEELRDGSDQMKAAGGDRLCEETPL